MSLQYTPHTIPLLLSAAIAALGAVVAWRRRRGQLERWGTVVQLNVMLWALLMFAAISLATETHQTLVFLLFFPVAASTGLSFLVFTIHFVGRSAWLTRRRLAALWVYPLAVLGISLTNGLHGQLLVTEGTVGNGFEYLSYSFEPLFYLLVAPIYVVTLVFIALLFQHFRRSRNVYRTMSFVLLVSLTVLVLATIPSVLQVSPLPYFMVFPYAYLAVGLFLVLGTSSAHFLRALPTERVFAVFNPLYGGTIPTARDVIVQEIDSGILVMDSDDVVVDVNPTAKTMLEADRPIGKPIRDVVNLERIVSGSAVTEIAAADELRPFEDELWVEREGEQRCYDVKVSELASDSGERVGHVALLHDITEQKRREEMLRERETELEERKDELETQKAQLEHQNERLDQFAGIVSHDLRNPLNVAQGRIQLAASALEDAEDPSVDIEHLRVSINSLDRMEEIIEDALTLARQGKAITEPEVVALDQTVTDAWKNVDTGDATLDSPDSVRVESDRNRLLNVFENLFRNAVEHGGESVSVRVGLLDDGFYVEDDGPGIPDDRKDSVFDEGFTTNSDGTGFGLAIVRDVVRAHGWEITVTDGTDGGARFEVTGVEFVE